MMKLPRLEKYLTHFLKCNIYSMNLSIKLQEKKNLVLNFFKATENKKNVLSTSLHDMNDSYLFLMSDFVMSYTCSSL